MNPVFMVLLENREQDGKEEHKMTFDMDSIIWLASFAEVWNMAIAGIFTGVGCIAGIPVLILIYNRIYRKYKT